MSLTDTSKKGLESLVVDSLVDQAGYAEGQSEDYDHDDTADADDVIHDAGDMDETD